MVSENDLLPVLRKIDSYYVGRNITSDEADDLTNSVVWLIGKSKNESNINQVIAILRGYKELIDKDIVSSVINEFRKAIG
jgi:hypothetical protein